jgi:hypothetical protein
MGYTFEDTMYSSQPQSDFDIVTASTENADVTSLKTQQTHEHMSCPMSKSPYKSKREPTASKLSKERRKMLMEKHVDLLDWIQCVDDGIVKGNLDEAKEVIKKLDDYADRLQQLLSEKYFNRARTLLLQLKEIEKVIQTDEMDRIRQEVDSYATVNAH